MIIRAVIVGCLLAAVGGAVFLCSDRPVQRTSGPIAHEAYIWQRVWTDQVRDAARAGDGHLSRVVVLAAETAWQDGGFAFARVQPDYAFLAGANGAVGLAIRIGPVPGGVGSGEHIGTLSDLAADVVAEARAAGVRVDELQIDYDCAESKLDGYRRLVAAIRGSLPKCDVTITVLPSWLDSGSFRALATETDGYVLQVHSLVLPTSVDDIPPLCDPAKALAWVERAARIGVAFRVALPTYGYRLAFNEEGKYVGLADGEGGRHVPLHADADEMTSLVGAWSRDRPKAMMGVIWYRLPVAGERMNWPWPTLQAVMDGRAPQPELQAIVRPVEPGLVEIDLHNGGTAPAPLDAAVVVSWVGDGPIASDGVGGFVLSPAGAGRLRAIPADSGSLLPDERRMIAWLRFADEREVTANVESQDE